jgi:SRSO17 transposase
MARQGGSWLLARRSRSDPGELAYYVCFAPADTSLVTLVQVAGCRWRVDEAFEQAKAKSVSITTRSANIRRDAGISPWPWRRWRFWP